MKNYAILALITIMAFTACKKESDNVPAETAAIEATVSGPVTSEPTLESFKLGEKWEWIEKSTAQGKIRYEGREHREVVAFEGGLGFWNSHDTIAVANTLGGEQGSTPFLSWPLQVGKKWTYESDWKNSEGTPMKTSMQVEVLSYGDEVVLAGMFKAYKIEYKGTITNAIGGSAEIHEVYWYAPALKANIKKMQDDGYGFYVLELYDYKSGESK